MSHNEAFEITARVFREYDSTFVCPIYIRPELRYILDDNFPLLAYNEEISKMLGDRKTIHWGQRKLLMEELNLILENMDKEVILYVGAGPGNHIPFLASLFPKLLFVLYDPVGFSFKDTDAPPNIEIHADFFTNDEATRIVERFNPSKLIYLSDIRLRDDTQELPNPFRDIKNYHSLDLDNKLQLEWLNIMKPSISSLKFRLPWGDVIDMFKMMKFMGPNHYHEWTKQCIEGKKCTNPKHGDHTFFDYENTEPLPPEYDIYYVMVEEEYELLINQFHSKYIYVEGERHLQCWSPPESSEVRLIVKLPDSKSPLRMVTYDPLKHEQQLYFHNNFYRSSHFIHPPCEGLDNCFDCTFEHHILSKLIPVIPETMTIPRDVAKLSAFIDTLLSKNRDKYTIISKEERLKSFSSLIKNRKQAPENLLSQYKK